MCEWIDFALWHQCEAFARTGHVFEIANNDGQTLLTECVEQVELPYDWKSPPLRFRVVEDAAPVHSNPLPRPQEPQ